jgi:hypothetical protein
MGMQEFQTCSDNLLGARILVKDIEAVVACRMIHEREGRIFLKRSLYQRVKGVINRRVVETCSGDKERRHLPLVISEVICRRIR